MECSPGIIPGLMSVEKYAGSNQTYLKMMKVHPSVIVIQDYMQVEQQNKHTMGPDI